MSDSFKSQKFGRLTYLCDDSKIRNAHKYCRWKCDCGQEIISQKSAVLYGHTRSCGCSRHLGNSKLWRGVGEISGAFWNRITRGAIHNKHKVIITLQEAWDLFLKQNRKCALTGELLHFAKAGTKSIGGTASLDRINSDKEYTLDNVQWVHKDINRMKSNIPQSTFITWCKRVVDKHSKNG